MFHIFFIFCFLKSASTWNSPEEFRNKFCREEINITILGAYTEEDDDHVHILSNQLTSSTLSNTSGVVNGLPNLDPKIPKLLKQDDHRSLTKLLGNDTIFHVFNKSIIQFEDDHYLYFETDDEGKPGIHQRLKFGGYNQAWLGCPQPLCLDYRVDSMAFNVKNPNKPSSVKIFRGQHYWQLTVKELSYSPPSSSYAKLFQEHTPKMDSEGPFDAAISFSDHSYVFLKGDEVTIKFHYSSLFNLMEDNLDEVEKFSTKYANVSIKQYWNDLPIEWFRHSRKIYMLVGKRKLFPREDKLGWLNWRFNVRDVYPQIDEQIDDCFLSYYYKKNEEDEKEEFNKDEKMHKVQDWLDKGKKDVIAKTSSVLDLAKQLTVPLIPNISNLRLKNGLQNKFENWPSHGNVTKYEMNMTNNFQENPNESIINNINSRIGSDNLKILAPSTENYNQTDRIKFKAPIFIHQPYRKFPTLMVDNVQQNFDAHSMKNNFYNQQDVHSNNENKNFKSTPTNIELNNFKLGVRGLQRTSKPEVRKSFKGDTNSKGAIQSFGNQESMNMPNYHPDMITMGDIRPRRKPIFLQDVYEPEDMTLGGKGRGMGMENGMKKKMKKMKKLRKKLKKMSKRNGKDKKKGKRKYNLDEHQFDVEVDHKFENSFPEPEKGRGKSHPQLFPQVERPNEPPPPGFIIGTKLSKNKVKNRVKRSIKENVHNSDKHKIDYKEIERRFGLKAVCFMGKRFFIIDIAKALLYNFDRIFKRFKKFHKIMKKFNKSAKIEDFKKMRDNIANISKPLSESFIGPFNSKDYGLPENIDAVHEIFPAKTINDKELPEEKLHVHKDGNVTIYKINTTAIHNLAMGNPTYDNSSNVKLLTLISSKPMPVLEFWNCTKVLDYHKEYNLSVVEYWKQLREQMTEIRMLEDPIVEPIHLKKADFNLFIVKIILGISILCFFIGLVHVLVRRRRREAEETLELEDSRQAVNGGPISGTSQELTGQSNL